VSSSQNKFPQPPNAASSAQQQAAAVPPESTSPSETIMDQHLKTTLTATPPTPPTPPAPPTPPSSSAMSSTASDPVEPAVPAAPVVDAPEASSESAPEESKVTLRQQPIPPASEPMQYRAIGLVRGKYVASEEQFTKGNIITDDGAEVDAVLLGRVMSLVKKHIDLEQSHLWVVYPRTRENVEGLHVQIVGVWEPEKLNRAEAAEGEEAPETEEALAEDLEAPDDKYFSVRGEVVFHSPEDHKLLVKIRRAPQQGSDESKIFKVALHGDLEGKVVGYFWDLQVERQGSNLMVREGTRIGIVPPQKKAAGSKGGFRRGGPPRRGGFNGPRREGGSQRPVQRGGDRASSTAPSTPRPQFSKPVKRSKESQPEATPE
jgi:hypothetical protein